MELKIGMMEINQKRGLTFAWIERKAPALRLTFQSVQNSLCGLCSRKDPGGDGSDRQVVNITRTVGESSRDLGRSLMNREKHRPKNDPSGTPGRTRKKRLA